MRNEFTPKLFTLIREGITKEQLLKDILAGIIVGIVALPLAIAFAIASGVSPEKGLITAFIAGFIISTFGGSRVQIGGPTGAFVIIIYDIVQSHGIEGLTLATFMAGFIIIGMGAAQLGNYLRFIPYPLIIGFTSGIALIIFSTQIKDFFGLTIEEIPSGFFSQWQTYIMALPGLNWYATGISIATIVIIVNFKRITTVIPGSVIAILLSTVVVQWFNFPVSTIQSTFGDLTGNLQKPSLPSFDFDTIQSLIQPAFAIAILGGIESLLSAVVADGMTGGKHRPNMELIAQGGANVFSALFAGIPATGAIARTATNIKNGGRTPIAGIIHAVVLLLILLFLMPYAKLIPLACLAGVLVVVAYHMSEWRQFRSVLKGDKMDIMVLMSTFLLTVIFDLIIAIEIGMVLASFLFMKRMSESVQVEAITPENDDKELLFQQELGFSSSKEIILYEIDGPLFFGAAQQFHDALVNTNTQPKIVILRMRYVPFIDSTGYQRLKDVVTTFQEEKIDVVLSGVNKTLRQEFITNGLFLLIPEEDVFENIEPALSHAQKKLTEIEQKETI
ncbi:SulP family inorganic anion transporter [Rhodohalobacter sp. 614A]|uniref:SulP family inorganic anion transporter n=1 Tax=Rhodohalobacter sp. 614A TaxID=2908649 RepID=UPI001EEAA6CF|nr:SulP family inorganic anion transporter [Rhodohalobacter sp. 614A]